MTANGDGHFDHEDMGVALADVAVASGMVRRIEDIQANRFGRRVSEVRKTVARHVRTSAATVANIRRQRRKFIPSWMMAAIRNELIRVLQAEIRALEHEIAIARQVGLDPRDDAFCAAEAQINAAREILQAAAQGS